MSIKVFLAAFVMIMLISILSIIAQSSRDVAAGLLVPRPTSTRLFPFTPTPTPTPTLTARITNEDSS